jgi:hypothetical protein
LVGWLVQATEIYQYNFRVINQALSLNIRELVSSNETIHNCYAGSVFYLKQRNCYKQLLCDTVLHKDVYIT